MISNKFSGIKSSTFLNLFVLITIFAGNLSAQTNQKTIPEQTVSPKITKVDDVTVKELFKPNAENKPLLVNFWATWCVPCREEFPDLVKIDEEFKGKIDFITISLDDLAEMNREVPQFLIEMKAKMPAYLLYTSNENEVIGAISKDWSGGLPFTVLYNEKRELVFTKQGKIKSEILTEKINELLNSTSKTEISELPINTLPNMREIYTYEKGIEQAKNDIANGIFRVKYYGLVPMMTSESTNKLREKYGIEVIYNGCLVFPGEIEYGKGYNEISIAAIKNKFGEGIF